MHQPADSPFRPHAPSSCASAAARPSTRSMLNPPALARRLIRPARLRRARLHDRCAISRRARISPALTDPLLANPARRLICTARLRQMGAATRRGWTDSRAGVQLPALGVERRPARARGTALPALVDKQSRDSRQRYAARRIDRARHLRRITAPRRRRALVLFQHCLPPRLQCPRNRLPLQSRALSSPSTPPPRPARARAPDNPAADTASLPAPCAPAHRTGRPAASR